MASESSSSGLASSFTDLMTSLAVIFILLLVAVMQDTVVASAARKQHTEKVRGDILDALLPLLNDPSVKVMKDPKDKLSLLIVVSEERLQFEVNKDKVSTIGQQFLNRFIPILVKVACGPEFSSEIASIAVEGHTDSSSLKKSPVEADIDNLDLSQDRSREVEVYSLKRLYDDKGGLQAYYPCFLHSLTASGRGSNDLIYGKDSKEDFARSPRVEFRIRVRSFEQREMQTGEAALASLQPPGSRAPSGNSNGSQPSKH